METDFLGASVSAGYFYLLYHLMENGIFSVVTMKSKRFPCAKLYVHLKGSAVIRAVSQLHKCSS